MTVAEDAAKLFRAMADRIERNSSEAFGGAMLAVPPNGEGIVEMLIFDSTENLGQFWGLVQSRAQLAIRDQDEQSRRMRGFAG